jgi:hypothetical protein
MFAASIIPRDLITNGSKDVHIINFRFIYFVRLPVPFTSCRFTLNTKWAGIAQSV